MRIDLRIILRARDQIAIEVILQAFLQILFRLCMHRVPLLYTFVGSDLILLAPIPLRGNETILLIVLFGIVPYFRGAYKGCVLRVLLSAGV